MADVRIHAPGEILEILIDQLCTLWQTVEGCVVYATPEQDTYSIPCTMRQARQLSKIAGKINADHGGGDMGTVVITDIAPGRSHRPGPRVFDGVQWVFI